MRLLTLTAYKNSLEMRIQSVTENMMGLQDQIDELVTIGADLDPDSDALKDLKAKKERLNLIEKKLEMQQKQFQTQLEAVNQEIQSCQQRVVQNVQGLFSYSLGGGRQNQINMFIKKEGDFFKSSSFFIVL